MLNQTSCILNEVSEDEKLIETHTPHFESLKKNIRRSEKSHQRNVNENKDSTIQQNNEIIISLIQQFRNTKTTMLRFHNLQ